MSPCVLLIVCFRGRIEQEGPEPGIIGHGVFQPLSFRVRGMGDPDGFAGLSGLHRDVFGHDAQIGYTTRPAGRLKDRCFFREQVRPDRAFRTFDQMTGQLKGQAPFSLG